VIFFEMLTGRRPFPGDTPGDALSSILKDDPPPVSSLREGVPREIGKLVRRCLAKAPSRRMQSALDVRIELEEVKRDIDSGELAAQPRPASSEGIGFRRAILSAVLAAAIAVLGLAAWLMTGAQDGRLELRNARQVTFAAGAETEPVWSPDGGRIAYAAGGHIWVVQAGGGPAVPLTQGLDGVHRQPAWSPDGGQIAFDTQGQGVYVMPAIGGSPTRLSPRGTNPDWSADGSEVAYLLGGAGAAPGVFIEIVSPRTRQVRQIPIPGDAGNRMDLSWSPDGRFFAYVRAPNLTPGVSQVWVLRTSDGQEVPVSDGRWNDWSPTWSGDGRSLFYVSNRGGTMDLWRQSISASGTPDGDPIPVTAGVGMQQAAFSADGRKLVYSQGRPVANLWRIPLVADREAGWEDAEQLTSDQALIHGVEVFPGSQRLVFSSDRGGSPNLWTMDLQGRSITRLTDDLSADLSPSVSRDGRRVAFHSYRSGSRDIWVVPAEGGPATRITRDPGSEMGPSWSPDGKELVFWGTLGGDASHVWVVPVAGGEPRRILDGPIYYPQWSPDGAWIAAAGGIPAARFTRVRASGGAPEHMPYDAGMFRWSGDGTGIYVMRDRDLWLKPLAGGAERRLTRLSSRDGALGVFTVARGPDYLYFTWRNDLGDIWVMDVARAR
jgi:Tol biopolymer transport system component